VVRDTLLDFFHDLSQARGDFLAHDDGFRSRSYTYDEVSRAARGFAARLHALGLRKGDAVVSGARTGRSGSSRSGAASSAASSWCRSTIARRRRFSIASAGSSRPKLLLIGQDVPPLDTPPLPVWKLHELDWTERDAPAVPIARDDVVEIIFTSGATADPKGVSLRIETCWPTSCPSSAKC
jgi:acyl-coenzyme A synthetase/AMP-(fatty) acid ligase